MDLKDDVEDLAAGFVPGGKLTFGIVRAAVKAVAVIIVLVIVLAFAAFSQGHEVEMTCGPTATTTLTDKGLDAGGKVGDTLRDLGTATKSPYRIVRAVLGMIHTIELWLRNFHDHANGLPEGSAATGWRNKTAQEQQSELAKCCPPPQGLPNGPDVPPTQPPAPEPWDPKTASLSNDSSLAGAELAADALIRAGFPRGEVPMFVAIAEQESSFIPGRVGPTVGGGTMRGMWQLNDRYWRLEDWDDPYANARMAKRVRDESVAAGKGPYKPWTTRGAAAKRASLYNDLAGNAPDGDGGTPEMRVDPPNAGVSIPTYCAPQTLTGGGVSNNAPLPQMVAELNPAGAGNWQAAVNSGTYWFVGHATAGDRTQVVHRLNGAGREVDQMVLAGADHMTSFGVTGSTVYLSWGGQIVTLPYQPGKTVHRNAAKPTGWTGSISLDPSRRAALIRNGNHYQAYNLTTRLPIGREVVTDTGTRQGFSMNGDAMYILTGATNGPARVDSYSLTSGAQTGTQDVTAVGAGRAREPEGMFGNLLGIKSGVGEKRRLLIFKLATVEPSQSTVRGSTGTRTVTSNGKTYEIPIPADRTGVAVNFALDQLGDKYVWGAHGPDAWDCSGLTQAAWKAAGVKIPGQSTLQRNGLPVVPLAEAQPGDIFWSKGHVQLNLGVIDGKQTVVEAANPKRGVRIDQTGWMRIGAVLRPNGGTAA